VVTPVDRPLVGRSHRLGVRGAFGWLLITGLAVQSFGNLWTLDRVVWFYEDVARERADLTAAAAAAGAQRGAA